VNFTKFLDLTFGNDWEACSLNEKKQKSLMKKFDQVKNTGVEKIWEKKFAFFSGAPRFRKIWSENFFVIRRKNKEKARNLPLFL